MTDITNQAGNIEARREEALISKPKKQVLHYLSQNINIFMTETQLCTILCLNLVIAAICNPSCFTRPRFDD